MPIPGTGGVVGLTDRIEGCIEIVRNEPLATALFERCIRPALSQVRDATDCMVSAHNMKTNQENPGSVVWPGRRNGSYYSRIGSAYSSLNLP